MYTPHYLPATRYGGPVRSVHELARGLVDLGHRVDLLTTDVDGPRRLDVALDRPTEMDGVQVHYCPIAAPRRLYYSPALARRAAELLPQADAVHVNGMFLWPGPHLSRAARRAGKALVISPRGMLMPELVAGKSRLVKLAWIALQERANLAAATAVHVTAQAEIDALRVLGLARAPMALLPNGVRLPDEIPSPAQIDAVWGDVPPGRRVGYLGRLGWNKGIDLAIEAVCAHPDAVIRLAGHDESGLTAKLEPRLKQLTGRPPSAFVGHLDGTTKWAFLAGADVMLMPTLQENFGNVLVEALAIGTPVIATEGVGASVYLRQVDAGLVVRRRQAALNQALAALLADAGRRARIGASGRALVADELQWPAIAARMAKIYDSATPCRAPEDTA